jgi:hypothetical protein
MSSPIDVPIDESAPITATRRDACGDAAREGGPIQEEHRRVRCAARLVASSIAGESALSRRSVRLLVSLRGDAADR